MVSIGLTVNESIHVKKEISEVFSSVANFHGWTTWSPWLTQEPDSDVIIDGAPGTVGHRQAWDGDFIGAGNMKLVTVEPSQSLEYELNFIKPWKSRSRVGFTFSTVDESTKIEWWMDGKLPFFLFFMKKQMTSFVASDYKRGLNMLKELIEEGSVPTRTTVEGVIDRAKTYYFGKRRECLMTDIGPTMSGDLESLSKLVEEGVLPQPNEVFSIYHKFDMVNGVCDYTTGFTYDSEQQSRDLFEIGEINAHKALKVSHVGPYRHVGNAWSAAMGCAKSKHKIDKSTPMYEVYVDDPHEVDEVDLRTSIFVPVRR